MTREPTRDSGGGSDPEPCRSRRPLRKLAFIGSHGVGKTTLTYGLAARLKARDVALEVLVEVARRCPLTLNEETDLAAQSWILHTQIADELVATTRYPLVLCDRSVLDNYVYLLLAVGRRPELETLIAHWLGTYDLLVHVPVVEGAPMLADGVRSTDQAFQGAVERRLAAELLHFGVEPLWLDPARRESWLEEVEAAVIESLRSPQLDLL
ncbi:MAG TPA: AAA family ATPase [Thermoanaerobaculia bacterium]|nr:AAA family ATPase [Thermoanaerobaculia bacterium]